MSSLGRLVSPVDAKSAKQFSISAALETWFGLFVPVENYFPAARNQTVGYCNSLNWVRTVLGEWSVLKRLHRDSRSHIY